MFGGSNFFFAHKLIDMQTILMTLLEEFLGNIWCGPFCKLMTARPISYIGREEHSSKDIAQVSQVEDVVEILLGKKLLLLKKVVKHL